MGLQNFHTANDNKEQMAVEVYSPRGPERDAPADLLVANSDTSTGDPGATPTPVPPAPDPSSSTNPIWFVLALVGGVLVGAVGVLAVRR